MTTEPSPEPKPQHTPGPWSIERGSLYDAITCVDGDICTWDHRGRSDPPSTANARLLAAAPELLAALKNLVAFFDVDPDSSLPEELKAQYRQVFRRDPYCQEALAAIAKAEPE